MSMNKIVVCLLMLVAVAYLSGYDFIASIEAIVLDR